MTLTSLTIQTEAWVQEEIAAQRKLLEILGRTEQAARSGASAALAQSGAELEAALALAPARSARRGALLGKLAPALGLPASAVTLSKLASRLAADGLANGINGERLNTLRQELREVVAAVARTGRRLGALARYHSALSEELCALLQARAPGQPEQGALIDAQG